MMNDTTEKINSDVWRQEVFSAYFEGREYADKHKLPLIFVGYSLGGLLGIDLMEVALRRQPQFRRFDKMVLLAPALRLRWHASLIKLLYFVGGEVMLPSLAPVYYRAKDATSINAYKAIWNLLDGIERPLSDFDNSGVSCQVPVLVVMDSQDELVDYGAIKNFINKYGGQCDWRLQEIGDLSFYLPRELKSSQSRRKIHHLIIDPNSFRTAQSFDLMMSNVLIFLNSKLQDKQKR
ncbi:MAG: hypothetical protein HQK53_14025 [Oligoflexia bacterium]|nr:hypothetical protein [Oligoflexia bacterium]